MCKLLRCFVYNMIVIRRQGTDDRPQSDRSIRGKDKMPRRAETPDVGCVAQCARSGRDGQDIETHDVTLPMSVDLATRPLSVTAKFLLSLFTGGPCFRLDDFLSLLSYRP